MSDERFIDSPPAGADGWREVWRDDRRYRGRTGLVGSVAAFVRKLVAPELERQRDFNLVLLDLVRDLRDELAALRSDLKADVAGVGEVVRRGDDALAADIARTREMIPVASMRNDALISALDQKIETVAVRVRDVTNPIVAAQPHSSSASSTPPQLASDFLYRRLEDGMRGSEAEVRDAVAPYVERARAQQPLIDVGCGRGELLVACREGGIEARGFDTNERSVADLRARGIDVALAGVPECFASIADGSVGSVVAMHVVEHLPVELLFALFAQAARVLRPGGLLMIETPNAESLAVIGGTFWRDPTHLAPRHPAALTLLGREHGFSVEELRAVHPFPEGNRLPLREDDSPSVRRIIELLNERLFAGQDLRLVLRKS
jgi:SAM-dependent methyltransferase